MLAPPAHPTQMHANKKRAHLFKTAWQHRSLILELTKREFSSRYKGSYAGLAWPFLQPLFLLAVYTVAFGVILKPHWNDSDTTTNYALTLFAGLIIFNACAETTSKSATAISSNPNFVKRIVFPLELLPAICVATALIQALIGIAVWTIGYIILVGTPKPQLLLTPLLLLCIAPLLLGFSWLFSAAGVLIRDTHQLTSMLNHMLLFLTPIFYRIENTPSILQPMLLLNPLTFPIEQLRTLMLSGGTPPYPYLALYFLATCLFAYLSLQLFRRLRAHFADLV